MLFAKGVLLVEGDAELFLVPALAKCLGFDFDELGITVCSVAGTNFAPYVRFLGPHGLKMPFAILTDLDPGDDGGNLGEKRVAGLIAEILPANQLSGKSGAEILKVAKQHGIFLNEHTLEIDLFRCRPKGTTSVMIALTDSQVAKKRAKEWQDAPAALNTKQFLGDIKAIGKGRFAQRLACRVKGNQCPQYISEAISYVAKRCR
jgi:putative ATP-dependent endonuclease of the OLD family